MLGVRSVRIRLWPWWRPWCACAAAGVSVRARAAAAPTIARGNFECIMRNLQLGTCPGREGTPEPVSRPEGDYGTVGRMVRTYENQVDPESDSDWNGSVGDEVGDQVSLSQQRASRAEV